MILSPCEYCSYVSPITVRAMSIIKIKSKVLTEQFCDEYDVPQNEMRD